MNCLIDVNFAGCWSTSFAVAKGTQYVHFKRSGRQYSEQQCSSAAAVDFDWWPANYVCLGHGWTNWPWVLHFVFSICCL